MPNTELMSRETAYRWIEGVTRAAEAMAAAMNAESSLEDLRALVKAEAIKRIMAGEPNQLTGKPHSSSSAEAVVESDSAYQDHRAMQREAVQSVIICRARYETAKLKARFAVERWTIEGGDGDVADEQPVAAVSAELNPANPVYRGLPWATLRTNPDGSIGAVDVDSKHDIPEAERKAKAIETMRRTKRQHPETATSNQEPTDD